jgi:hypothetical protein
VHEFARHFRALMSFAQEPPQSFEVKAQEDLLDPMVRSLRIAPIPSIVVDDDEDGEEGGQFSTAVTWYLENPWDTRGSRIHFVMLVSVRELARVGREQLSLDLLKQVGNLVSSIKAFMRVHPPAISVHK